MKTILIVDDEKNIVSGLEEAFTLEGYSVLTAYDGKEAWDKQRRPCHNRSENAHDEWQ